MNEERIFQLLKSRGGRQQAFAELLRLYSEPLYWHLRRMVVVHEDVEDILQEAFVKAYNSVDRFEGRSSLKTWLYRIATNEALRHLQSRKRHFSGSEDNTLVERFAAEQGVDFDSVEAQLQRSILALPEKQRLVFNLRYYDEMSYQQIAEVTGQSVATLKTNYHYAAERVKDLILNDIDV